MKNLLKSNRFAVFIILTFLIYVMSNGEWCIPIFAWIYPILFLCMIYFNRTRKNSSNPAVFSESFTIYLLVEIKNGISRYYYFCKYNGINRVYHLSDIPCIGRVVWRLYTIPKSIPATNSNGNRDLRNHLFNVLDGGNGYMDLEQ